MLIKSKDHNIILPSEITDREIYEQRRDFIRQSGQFALAAATSLAAPGLIAGTLPPPKPRAKIAGVKPGQLSSTVDTPNSYKDITSYCNFYEFGTGKRDPERNAHTLKPRPWKVTVEGEVAKPGAYDLEDILKPHDPEERIYHLRFVEARSVVVPRGGFPPGALVKRFLPAAEPPYGAVNNV